MQETVAKLQFSLGVEVENRIGGHPLHELVDSVLEPER